MRLRGSVSGLYYTLALAVGLLVAFAWATYLSYYGGVNVKNAFEYQSDVVAAQRDVELLDVEQFDRHAPPGELREYRKLLDADLSKISGSAETENERAPTLGPLATQQALADLE